MSDNELWKPIPGHDKYEVSNFGRVRSLKHREPRILAGGRVGKYRMVLLTNRGRTYTTYYVHHLVAQAFLGAQPDGTIITHLDSDKSNNHISNLAYVTRSEAFANHHANGVMGDRKGTSYALAEDEIENAVLLRSQRVSPVEIAERYGVHPATVSTHVNRRAPHLKRLWKLSHDNIQRIRTLREDGWTMQAIADEYDVSLSMISRILGGHRHANKGGAS